MSEQRNTAIFINGGAGRVIASIPALELFTEENHPDVRKVRPTGGTGMTLGDFFDN